MFTKTFSIFFYFLSQNRFRKIGNTSRKQKVELLGEKLWEMFNILMFSDYKSNICVLIENLENIKSFKAKI